jgi:hypothetical protein
MNEAENLLVQGKLSISGSKLKITDTVFSTYQDAVLHLQSANGLAKTNAFGKGSDPYCIVFRASRSEGGDFVEIYRSKTILKTLDPKFNELVIFQVPCDDDWSGMSLRVELWDVTLDFLGCILIKGNELMDLISADCDEKSVAKTYDLLESKLIPSTQQGFVKGKITIKGGLKSYYDTVIFEEDEIIINDDNSVTQATTAGANIEVPALPEVYNEKGDEAIISIHKARDLSKADMFLGKSDPYCVIKWNNKEIGRTSIISSNLNPRWEEESFKVFLAEGNNPNNSKLEIEVWDMDSVGGGNFLGMVSLTGVELISFLVPTVEDTVEQEFVLKPSPMYTPRTNALAVKGHITISAVVPSLNKAPVVKEKVKSNDPSLKVTKYEIQILCAKNLAKANLFGVTTDSYVQIYWPDCTTLFGSTQVVPSSLNPIFDSEIFIITKEDGINLTECELKLVVNNKGTIKGDVFLGEIILTGDELKEYLSLPIDGFKDYDLLKSLNLADNQQLLVQGNLKVSCRELGVDIVPAVHNLDAELPKGMKDMEITILAASGLAKADTFGSSDPYCVLRWIDTEIGKTSVIKENINPVWEDDQCFIFRTPEELGKDLDVLVKENEKKIRTQSKIMKKQKALNDLEKIGSNKNNEGTVSKLPKDFDNNIKSVREILMKKQLDLLVGKILTIDVYDWNRLGSEVFLGCIELQGEELNDFASGGGLQRKWFDLTSTYRLKKKDQKLVKGKIELMLGERQSLLSLTEAREGEIIINSARGLAKADTFGSADPFVKIRWNNKYIGKTKTIKNTLNPIWDEEKHIISMPKSMKLEDCILYMEVWDWDRVGTDSFLGSLKISGEPLKDLFETNSFKLAKFPLVKSEYLPEGVQDLVQGEIEISCGWKGSLGNIADLEGSLTYEFTIFSAENLARADGMFGLSDPFAVIKWDGREIGRTPYISKTLNPVWSDQFYQVSISGTDSISTHTLHIDVWDHNTLAKGEFLGCIILTGEELEEFVDCDEQRIKKLDLKINPWMTLEAQKLVQGQLELGTRKVLKNADPEEAPVFDVTWFDENDVDAGPPCLEVGILSGSNLCKTKSILQKSDPYCIIYWGLDEIGTTATANSHNPVWNNESFAMRITSNSEKIDEKLRIEIWDNDGMAGITVKGEFLGQIYLSYQSILCLHDGTFELPTIQKEKYQHVRGSLTISLRFYYPFWDSIRPIIPTKMIRRVRVLSGFNFPIINDERPSTKCVIFFLGIYISFYLFIYLNVCSL